MAWSPLFRGFASGIKSVPEPRVRAKPAHMVGHLPRAARRDPVGNGRTEDTALKCSFSGVTGLAPERLEQTGVHVVGCPECGAMRTVQSHTKAVTFPSHQRRLTPPPSGEVRWLKHGTEWELNAKGM